MLFLTCFKIFFIFSSHPNVLDHHTPKNCHEKNQIIRWTQVIRTVKFRLQWFPLTSVSLLFYNLSYTTNLNSFSFLKFIWIIIMFSRLSRQRVRRKRKLMNDDWMRCEIDRITNFLPILFLQLSSLSSVSQGVWDNTYLGIQGGRSYNQTQVSPLLLNLYEKSVRKIFNHMKVHACDRDVLKRNSHFLQKSNGDVGVKRSLVSLVQH